MRVRGLAFIGLVVGAFISSQSSSFVSATAVQPHLTQQSSSIEKFFSSDAPESLHEAKNQGTLDEPKAWPEANAWLHASLSESEREFLSLAVTGSVNPNANPNGGLSSSQLSDSTGTVTVQLRFFRNSVPSNFASLLQNDLVSSLSGSTFSSVSSASFNQINLGGSNGIYQVATFSFSNSGSLTAGQQYQALTQQFSQSSSALRSRTTFQDIDLSFYPSAFFVGGQATATPTTRAPVTVTPTTQGGSGNSNYCASFPSTCLNGGTCVNTPNTSPFYSCTCPSGYIGQQCQFSLFNNSKRNKVQGVLPRGRSVTRPNAVRTSTVKLAQ